MPSRPVLTAISVQMRGPGAADPLTTCRPLGVEAWQPDPVLLAGWRPPPRRTITETTGFAGARDDAATAPHDPARRSAAARVAAGQHVRVINTHGCQVVDTWAFRAGDVTEWMSMEASRAWFMRRDGPGGRLLGLPAGHPADQRRTGHTTEAHFTIE